MSLWTLITHLSSILALVNAGVSFVKSVIANKAMPSVDDIDNLLEALRGIMDSGLVPLTTEEQQGLDAAFVAIEAQLKKA